ncbi:MAG: band 7 protein [bacterium]|nr:band 7 protein [bacterium]
MLGIKFIKTKPTEFVLFYKKGKLKSKGAGLSFFYYGPTSNIVIVPADSRDVLFMFKETTSDFQECDIQGQLTYRVADPEKLASMLDFSVSIAGDFSGDGNEKLPERVSNIIQVTIKQKIQSMTLIQALSTTGEIVSHAKTKLKEAESMTALGIELIDFSIVKISPTPDTGRALEAKTREELLKSADEAIYERRNFAIDQERKIKENELQTEIAVEEKNREIREEQMNVEIAVQEKQKVLEEARMKKEEFVQMKKQELAQQKTTARIELEEQKKELVALQAENQVTYARARAESVQLELGPLAGLDPKLLEVLASNQMDSRQIISKAIKDLANNAEKIGNLNISPDLLNSLMGYEE